MSLYLLLRMCPPLLYTHNQLDTYTCGNIVNTIMTNETQFFRKIYLSHFIRNGTKGLRKGYVWEVSWSLNKDCHILTPSSSGYSSTSFSFPWAAQLGALRAASPQSETDSHAGILSPRLWLQLTELPIAPGYIIVWHPPASCERHICTEFNLSTVKAIPWYLGPDAPVPWLTAGSICYTMPSSFGLWDEK